MRYIPYMLSGIALVKYLLKIKNHKLETGIILLAENTQLARQFALEYAKEKDVKVLKSWHKNDEKMRNYEVGIIVYFHGMQEKTIVDFLQQEDFLPVLIIGGILPDFLRTDTYIFPVKTVKEIGKTFKSEYAKFKKFVTENANFLLKQICVGNYFSHRYSRELDEELFCLDSVLRFVSDVWNFSENTDAGYVHVSRVHVERKRIWTKMLKEMERFRDDYDVHEAVNHVMIKYFQKNTKDRIRFCNIYEGDEDVKVEYEKNNCVFYDESYYYFPHPLVKKMCEPLINSISFLQLKREMSLCGMIECNSLENNNFTVKKILHFQDTEVSVRARFLKIKKNYLETEEGIPLEFLDGNRENKQFFMTEEEGGE